MRASIKTKPNGNIALDLDIKAGRAILRVSSSLRDSMSGLFPSQDRERGFATRQTKVSAEASAMPMTFAEHERKLKAPAVASCCLSGSSDWRQHHGSHQWRICCGL